MAKGLGAAYVQHAAGSWLSVSLAFAGVALGGCTGNAPSPDPVRITGRAMGTSFSVAVAGPAVADIGRLATKVREAIDRVDSLMSTYREDSDVSKLNRHPVGHPLQVSEETLEVLEAAQRVGELTGGAFDVTVGALVDAWGFGPASPAGPPDPQAVLELQRATGWDKIELDRRQRVVRKLHARSQIDLSGIAKGFAVDQVAETLEDAGHRSYLVDIGGEVRVGAERAPGRPWRIGVERPEPTGRLVHRILAVSDTAMATSGNYRNFRERQGRRYGHVLDPRTGHPSETDIASATVLDTSAMRADAVATAMLVLGSKQAISLAEREGLPVLLLVADVSAGWRQIESSAFRARMSAGAR